MDGRMDKWIKEWIEERMDGWMDGLKMDGSIPVTDTVGALSVFSLFPLLHSKGYLFIESCCSLFEPLSG
jgi:hypothetical protein